MPALPKDYEQVAEGSRFRVKKVPIFAETAKLGADGKKYAFDRAWLEKAAAYGNSEQARGYYAPVHLAHNVRGNDPEKVADLENYVVEDADYDRLMPVAVDEKGEITWAIETVTRAVLFADLVFDNAQAIDKAVAFPHRSVEVYEPWKPTVNSLALLGAMEPHLRFPNLRLDRVPSLVCAGAPSGPGVVAEWSQPMCFERTALMPPEAKLAEDVKKAVLEDQKKAKVAAEAEAEEEKKLPENEPSATKDDDTPGYAKALHEKAHAIHTEMAAGHKAILEAIGKLDGVAHGDVPGKPGGLDGLGDGVVKPVAMQALPADASKRIAQLEAELAVSRDKAASAERRLSVTDAITRLEHEGYAVGVETRKLFEAVAAKGESIDTVVAAVRTNAPRLPGARSDRERGTVAAESLAKPDHADVIKVAPNAESPERKQAREAHLQFELIRKNGALRDMPFERFFKFNRDTFAGQPAEKR